MVARVPVFLGPLGRRAMRTVAVAALTLGIAAGWPAPRAGAQDLVGAGATSIQPAVDAGFVDGNAYSGVGSGAGRAMFVAGTVDFASSDAVGVDGACNVNALNIPVSVISNGTQAIDSPTLCGLLDQVFNGGTCPTTVEGLPFTIVVRADVSGTTALFNMFLASACSPAVQIDSTVSLPCVVPAQGTDGEIAAVQGRPTTEVALGYADTPAAVLAGVTIDLLSLTAGPNYMIFRPQYATPMLTSEAQALCQLVTGSGRDLAVGLGYLPGSDSADVCACIQQP